MKRALGAGIASVAIAWCAFAGCSLDLDESKIDARGDASANADDGSRPATDGGSGADSSDAGRVRCSQDNECVPENACLTGKCDQTRKVCVFDVCRQPAACTSSACDTQAKRCGAPAPYAFHASQFKVTAGGVGCGAASRCFAAAYPFIFVGTTNGVVAYPAADPGNASPTPIPVTGLPFLPQQILASGNRVYFVGSLVGAGQNAKLPLAWIDIPSDPLARSLSATTVLDTAGQPNVAFAFPSSDDALLLVVNDPPRVFPSLSITAPFQDLATLSFFPLAGIPANATPVVSSGSRLVTYRWQAYVPQLSLETGAGTAAAQNGGEQAIAGMGPMTNQVVFASGADGSVLASALAVTLSDAGVPQPRAVRLTWLVADGNAAFDATASVDVETYGAPPSGTAVGPVAWIDAQNALVTAQLKSDPAQTVVRIATKGTPPTISQKQFQIAKAVDGIGAAASNGLAYVLVADSANDATVHVFSPGCN